MTHAPADQPCTCGLAGWMPGVSHQPIQWTMPSWVRQRTGQMQPRLIVDHIMQGYLTTMEGWAEHGQSQVIVHFGIDRVGRTVQFHPVNTPGIHVSAINSPQSKIVQQRGQDSGTTGANGYTIGIEHEGCSVKPPYSVPASLIYSKTNPWPDAMVEASIKVKVWCFKTVQSLGIPSRDTVIGHYEIDARNRPDDPAAHTDRSVWPVERMLAALGKPPEEEQDMDPGYTLVKPGETLSAVSRRTGFSVTYIATLNEIEDPAKVQAWQPLRLYSSLNGKTLEKPALFGFSNAPADLSRVQTQIDVIQRAAGIAEDEIAKIGGG